MKNKFIMIITVHNNSKWLDINFQMNKFQSYKNFECVYIDDQSSDNSFEKLNALCEDDSRFHVIKSSSNLGQYNAFFEGIDYLKSNKLIHDDDIIVDLDGDDWVSSVFVLEYLNSIYTENLNIWMTYGQYQIYPSGNVGGHYTMDIPDIVDTYNSYRSYQFPVSHLKTYKYHLLNKVNRRDLIDTNTGKYYRHAFDHALCIPMVEMAGKSRIHKCNDILYILNRSDELENEGKFHVHSQKNVESKIRQLTPYNRI